MKKINPLHYKKLRLNLSPNSLRFKTTDEVTDLPESIVQDRVLEAVDFGMRIKSQGFNLFVMGAAGINKTTIIRSLVTAYAISKKTPPDWCYRYNFSHPERPIAFKLPAGLGTELQSDMKSFIEDIRLSILTVFESDEYRDAMREINAEFNKKREKIPKKLKDKIEGERIPKVYRERHEQEEELQLRLALNVVKPYIDRLKIKYAEYPKIIHFLDSVQEDVLLHVSDFIKRDEISGLVVFDMENPILVHYQINVIINNHHRIGVPVVIEQNPSYSNLICRVEYQSQMGTLVTDFMLIRPGALHRANGGFLLIEAHKLLDEKLAWEALKSALYSGRIKIEPLEELTETVRPVSLKPKSIPLKIKIVLFGTRSTYYKLCKKDPDFNELFKVTVDFDDTIERNAANIQLYAHLIAGIVKRRRLRRFHASAVAAIIDHSTRFAEDIKKLSTHIQRIDDLVQESDYWGKVAAKKVIDARDVKKAIQAQIFRLDRARQLYYEEIIRKFILINTKDKSIGQVNCLSVITMGKFSYGHPTRVTAKVRVGKGKLIDIQREIELAGPIHSKACFIIGNFLADRYSRDKMFSLTASISFEQIYGSVDGDSASVGELCALLSAIANIPLKQYLSVTGSIDQYGEVQAIGYVNEKIEGYFDICKSSGLTGKQGVIIPAINQQNLMLREDVVAAAKAKKFFIYPIETIDQAIYLLTGIEAGKPNKKGQFPKNSVNHRVQTSLEIFSLTRYKSTRNLV